ncbi:hypothetical protein [Belliella pelovolcani]|uniref:Uncharacterized protein n=1 Tax=Belliella pelovolcani TaxID=529505 RepID=A0A1N7Q5F6_9BACT|nr:hypothetical protein [Belliella pelovolcani]SIT17949.1 hypothetical protein SAMN05421761_1315 [Belliella pelovolcani]
MKTLQFDLKIIEPLSIKDFSIYNVTFPLKINLNAGRHYYKSKSVEIGKFHGNKIFAFISIPAYFDPISNLITIAGIDDQSKDQISIHTYFENQSVLSKTIRINNSVEDYNPSNLWSDFLNNFPIVNNQFIETLKHNLNILIKEFLNSGVHGVIQTGKPPIVTHENYHDYKSMFINKTDDKKSPDLHDIIELQNVIKSSYKGIITFSSMAPFANVIGSTNDPKPWNTSWIKLWSEKCNNGESPSFCTSYQYSNGAKTFNCGNDFVGGHVIKGTEAIKINTGGTVYIFPICKAHNNNDKIYMSIIKYSTGVVLDNYNKLNEFITN